MHTVFGWFFWALCNGECNFSLDMIYGAQFYIRPVLLVDLTPRLLFFFEPDDAISRLNACCALMC